MCKGYASVVEIPITVKTRIGIDNFKIVTIFSVILLKKYIKVGAMNLLFMQRKAWLSGLSQKKIEKFHH